MIIRSIVCLILTLGFAVSCDSLKKAASSAEEALFEDPAYEPNSGLDVADQLAQASGASGLNLVALSEALGVAEKEGSEEVLSLMGFKLAEEDSEVSEVSGETIDLLKEGAQQKANFGSGSFNKPSLDGVAPEPPKGSQYGFKLAGGQLTEKSLAYDPKTDKISEDSWGGLTEILIPNLERVPVRNQAQRGTCASFAGIGALEYLFLKKYGDKVESVDFSEQRFYMMSKSNLWDSGGGTVDSDGGSAWSDGYAMSYGSGGKTSPSDTNPYNIPLELDCPYNGSAGSNELQIPQAATCRRGAVRVKSITETYQTKTGNDPWVLKTSGVREAQEVFNYMKDKGLPIPVSTVLTANWQDNDGMITLAKAQAGDGPHAGGHAYLIVGARKLDEAKFPNEGGMCFVIKNSWGTGWGVNGYSCMTLAWFNNYRTQYPYDFALDLEWDEAYVSSKMGAPSITQTTDEAPTAEEPAKEENPTTQVVTDPGVPSEPDNIIPAPQYSPDTEPKTTIDGYTIGRLVDKKGELKSILFKIAGATFSMKGLYPGLDKTTQILELNYNAGKLYFDDILHNKNGVLGGEVSGETVVLCSKSYSPVCELNLNKETNKLVIGVTEEEFLDYKPDSGANYETLFSFKNYGIEYYYPGGFYIDFKLILKGNGLVMTTTNPLRLKLKPSSQEVYYRGVAIGSLSKFQLCSGDFKSVCRFIVSSKDSSMNIFLKAKKKE